MSLKPHFIVLFSVLCSVLCSACALEADGHGSAAEPFDQSESALCNNALSRSE